MPPQPSSPSSGPLRSQVVLVLLSRLPRPVVLLGVLALVVGGLALPGVGGALLLVVVGGLLAWLLRLAWPVLTPSARAMRLVTVAALLGYAAWKATR